MAYNDQRDKEPAEFDHVSLEFTGVIPSLKGAVSLHGDGRVCRLLLEFDVSRYPEAMALLPQLMRHDVAVTMTKGLPVARDDSSAVFL